MKYATLRSNDIAGYWQDGIPKEWDTQGHPDLMYIDAENETYWQQFACEFIEDRGELIGQEPRHSVNGYTIGYYPLDVETWEMVAIGPFCAECTKPEYSDGDEGVIAYLAECIEGHSEESVYCDGCGETLWEEDIPLDTD